MSNRVSKAQAIALIQAAVKDGWERSVTGGTVPLLKDYRQTQCCLSASYSRGALYIHSHIMVMFVRRNGRWSITVKTKSDYEKKYVRGRFSAHYAIESYMRPHLLRGDNQLAS